MSGTLSPDGNWLWNGTEWIPAPPKDAPPPQQSFLNQDAGGNVSQITTPSQSIDTPVKTAKKAKRVERGETISGNMQTSQNLQPNIVLSTAQNNANGNLKQFIDKAGGRALFLKRARTNMDLDTFDLIPQFISQNSRFTMTHRWNTKYNTAGKQYMIDGLNIDLAIFVNKKVEKISIYGRSGRASIVFLPWWLFEIIFLVKSRFNKNRNQAIEIAALIEEFLSQNG